MTKGNRTFKINDIEFTVIYSQRRTLGISLLPDSSVIVRVPYFTSYKAISRIVIQKSDWIIKYRDSYRATGQAKSNKQYVNGEVHLFRGNELVLKIETTVKNYILFGDGTIKLGLGKPDDKTAVKHLLYKGYRDEATRLLPEMFAKTIDKYRAEIFKPSGLIIRTMKRRWGSCSHKGVITLSTELIKLPDRHIEYVIVHELCHLKQHNHGAMYYKLLSELFPEWKIVRKELKSYIR
jgi:predicted metal-dependent hydrolase